MTQKIYHLAYEEEDIQDHVLALHSNLEAYQIAFFLNQNASAKFKRINDIAMEDKDALFLMYEWENPLLDINTTLFSNKSISEKEQLDTNNNTLFNLPLRNEVSLFPKFKQVDFFIKSKDLETLKLLFKQLNSWKSTSMIYDVSAEKIKNRLNLIFD